MAYRVEKNQKNGQVEIVIDGWEKGIADSQYEGITRMLNLNPHYYPGALYPNYTRVSATSATIAEPLYWTQTNPNGSSINNIYFVVDSAGNTFQATAGSNFVSATSSVLSGTVSGIVYFSPTLQGNGLASGKSWLFGFAGTKMYYLAYPFSSNTWTQFTPAGTGLVAPNYGIWGQDNILYFTNGNFIASLQAGSSDFNPGGSSGTDYVFSPKALTLPAYETATFLAEQGNNLLTSAGNRIYPWNRSSTSFNLPIQFSEPLNKMIVINNIVYALAGLKGNIYISNGYSADLLKKIPDSFFGQNDPAYTWGGLMYHRNKLYFGVTTTTQGASNQYLSGIFSLTIGNGNFIPEIPGSLFFENQNSFGLFQTNLSGLASPNILIDDNNSSTDFYYSAWFSNGVGGIDKSSTSVYTDGSTFIETDLIPVGTYLTQTTPIQVEFKLDAPMTVGDSITVLGRKSFTDSYSQFGQVFTATANNEVGWAFPSSIENLQWVQLKLILTTAAGDVVRLREIRLRNGQ